jgi:hypothetical protein
VSAATPQGGFHSQQARACLNGAQEALNEAPAGPIDADVLAAHSAKAQVIASAAIAHALLEIGDILRAAATGNDSKEGGKS